jgi:Gpi18-like mannosyltransferase
MKLFLGNFESRFKEWQFPLMIFLITLIGLWGWMLIVRKIIFGNLSFDGVTHPYLGIQPEKNMLLEVWQRWDVLHYQWIATNGYSKTNLEPFGPLYPMLMRWSAPLFGNNALLAGLLISNLFCLAAMYALITLARAELGATHKAQQALLYLVIFPTSFFLFAPYTESIFLLGAVMTIKSVRQKKWVSAGFWGILAVGARLSAAVIILPVLYGAWKEWRESGQMRAWISPFLILMGASLFPLYTWIALELPPWVFLQTLNTGFQRSFNFPGFNIWLAIQNISRGIFLLVNIPDLIFCILFIAGTILVWKKLPAVYGVYTSGLMLLYLSTNTSVYPLLSMSRYVLVLFPVFIAMPAIIQNKIIHLIILTVMLTGLLFFSAQFALWGWVG